MDFLESLETIRAEEASVGRLFGGEGHRAGRRNPSPEYQRSLAEATVFLSEVLSGKRKIWQLQEALSTSDFPILFGDILDRSVLAAYREWRVNWDRKAARRTVRDFRPVRERPPLLGADSRLGVVKELTEYPEVALTEQDWIEYTVEKFGRRIGFSWEAIINDDLQELQDIPQRFGRAARRTEDYTATELHVDAGGPRDDIYTVANKNQIVTGNGASDDNPALTIAGLQDAFTVLANAAVDEDGEPIEMELVTLEVPPALEITANNILNATSLEIDTALGGGVTGQRLITANWMRNRLQLIVNPLLPLVAAGAGGVKNTQWYLHANPNVGRPAFRMAFLRGWEDPVVFVKEPNARRAGGGPASPLDGDFDTDSVHYKVRHVLGTVTIDAKMTVASQGTGNAWAALP